MFTAQYLYDSHTACINIKDGGPGELQPTYLELFMHAAEILFRQPLAVFWLCQACSRSNVNCIHCNTCSCDTHAALADVHSVLPELGHVNAGCGGHPWAAVGADAGGSCTPHGHVQSGFLCAGRGRSYGADRAFPGAARRDALTISWTTLVLS